MAISSTASGTLVPSSATGPALVAPPWTAWAYSGFLVSSGSGNVSTPGGTFGFSFHGAFGEAVVLQQQNTSSTAYALQGAQTIGSRYFVTLCEPSCSTPQGEANITLYSWQMDQAYANLSEAASVQVNGTSTPALGLVNDHTLSQGNMTRVMQWTYAGKGGLFSAGRSSTGFSFGSTATQGDMSVAFAPTLGLQPLSPSPGESWQSNSSYTGSSVASASYHLFSTGQGPTGSGNPSTSSSLSGNLTLNGGDQGRFHLGGGWVAHAFDFRYDAPFTFWDGLFLVPVGAAPFAGSGQPWERQGDLGLAGAPGSVDFVPGLGHSGWVSSDSTYAPDQIGVPAGPPPGASPAPWTGSGPGLSSEMGAGDLASNVAPVSLQTAPTSVSGAEALAAELPSPLVIQPLAPLPAGHAGPGWLLVGVAGVAVVLVVFLVVRGRRRVETTPEAYEDFHGEGDAEEDDDDEEPKGRPGSAGGTDPFGDLL